ncbi:KH domain RNA binding protein [Coccidioides immitis H538.4]|uniref:KH domain RNA binding protein n=1 Tax=Coccidioides immitis H538.4 TaxID=396776 RepID=A0A0J8RHM2_COCIT|nr:KH domain RNA binding protein [Coccidioides immitis H538.4]
MSASPTSAVASTKRPLEDPSSPSGPTDQPDAKRQALDKVVKGDEQEVKGDQDNTKIEENNKVEPTAETDGAAQNNVQDGQGDLVVPDAPNNGKSSPTAPLETQPIQSTASHNDRATSQAPGQSHGTQDETGFIHIRAVISSAEAATCIGKGGENVSQIRRLSGAKCTVSDYTRGAVERILTVSGPQDAVAKAFGLIIHSCLPLSTERSLVILGVADAVHIATYYVAATLVEQLTERFGGPAASAYATRSGGPAGVVPGGMQVVPYVPQPAGGQYGHPDSFKRHHPQANRAMSTGYGVPYMHGPGPSPHGMQQPIHYNASPRQGYTGAGPHQPAPYGAPQPPHSHGTPAQPMGAPVAGGPLTQQIFIPNDMVGAIIGKGGAKINEIRHLSGSVIKINEPQDNSNERLVTITGTQECNQMALYMLYSRLESEKHRI